MQFSVKHWKVILITFLLTSLVIRAQDINTKKFQYLSPVPGSSLNSPETNIIIKFGKAFSKNNIANSISVIGNKSGHYQGKIILAENGRTLIFKPKNEFADGETVTVELKGNLKTISNEQIPQLRYSFETSKVDLNKITKSDHDKYLKFLETEFKTEKKLPRLGKNNLQNMFNKKSYTIQQDSLPEDFPEFSVDSLNDPATGIISFTPFIIPDFSQTYLILTDNYGIPVFYRKMYSPTFDFKNLGNGTLAYYDLSIPQHYILDSSYNIIDSVHMQNGYLSDMHDFLVTKDHHYLLMCNDLQKVAMDTVVAGGDSNATVVGVVLQELDENKNVVFQWRSWDHYKITDATSDINLMASYVDYTHCNSIEIDSDGNILLSTRHFDEITKIDRQTGSIIWRFGGEYCKNNEFTFLNDPIGFSHQHDVRRLPNGNITLFDNGNLHNPRFSRVAEYQLDEVNKFASLVWEYRNDPQTYSGAMGSARRLYNHNTFICWGALNTVSISEVQANGTVAFYLTMPDTLLNYRAFKFSWKTNLFVTSPCSLDFGYVSPEDSSIRTLSIINNSDKEIEINGVLNRDSAFTMLTPLPIAVGAFGDTTVQIRFKPTEVKSYSDDLYLQWNQKDERITQTVHLSATTIVDVEKGNNNNFNFSLVQNYPNPFNPITRIEYSIPHYSLVMLKVYDILGREIATLVNEEKPSGNYDVEFDGSNLSSGIYFYKLQTGNYTSVKKMILMK